MPRADGDVVQRDEADGGHAVALACVRRKGGCRRAALLVAFAQNQPVQRYAGLIGYFDALLKR
nr:MAG TPA: hypothetical protein [Caudoviricetes sp.]